MPLLLSPPIGTARRFVTIILGFLALFNVPCGTVLGVYTLWVLLPAQSDAEYEKEVQTTAAA